MTCIQRGILQITRRQMQGFVHTVLQPWKRKRLKSRAKLRESISYVGVAALVCV